MYYHYHTQTYFIFSTLMTMSRRGSIYVVSISSNFHFSLIFIVINLIMSLKQTHLFFVHFLRISPIILDDKVDEESEQVFKQQNFNLRVLLSFCLTFCQFQPGIAHKSVAYKKKRVYYRCHQDGFQLRDLSKTLNGMQK